MPGNEETITRDAKPIQTTEPAEQQVYQPTWEPLEDDLLKDYAAFEEPLAQEFYHMFCHQQEQLHLPPYQMTEAKEPLQTAAPVQVPTQPALSEKDQKNLKKELEKKKTAGLKLTPGATWYTTDLMAQMKEYVTGRDDYQNLITKAVSTFQSKQEANKGEERTRMFGALLLFAPQTKLDPKTKHITQDSLQAQKAFLDQCTDKPETVINDIKQKMFSRTFSPEKYTQDYVGKHFQEIHEEQQQLKGFVTLFREGTPEYEALTPYEKVQVGILGDIYEKSDLAFRSALQANGLRYTDYGLIPMTREELNQCRNNPADVEALRQSTESMNDRRKKFLDEESERIIEHLSQEHKDDYNEMREFMAKDNRTSFITSKRLTHDYQYENIRDAKELIEKYADSTQYRANKYLIDDLFNEIVTLEEMVSSHYDRLWMINQACFVPQKVTDKEGNENEEILVKDTALQKALQAKSQIADEKSKALGFRISCIKGGLKHLLTGSPIMDNSVAQILSEYGYTDPAYEEKFRSTSDHGKAYAKNYKRREQLFGPTMKGLNFTPFEKDLCLSLININEGDYLTRANEVIKLMESLSTPNTEIGGDTSEIPLETRKKAKDLIKPYIEKIEKFDVLKWSQLSDEELTSHQVELMNIALPGMAIAFMNKYPDPDNPSISIAEALIDQKNLSSFSQNQLLAQGYMMKARSLAMIASYKNGTLTEESLLTSESDIAIDLKTGKVTEDSMLAFAKQQYIGAENLIAGVRRRIVNDPSIKEYFINLGWADTKYETQHDKFLKTQDEAVKELKLRCDFIKTYENRELSLQDCAIEESRKLRYKIQNLQHWMEINTDQTIREDLAQEVKKMQDRIEQYEIFYALQKARYRLAGEDHWLINEAILRSFDQVNPLPSFQSMSDEEFHNMCRLLAAGGFHFEEDTKEQTAEYRRQNKEGLLIYKKHMSEHYHYLEAKYHHKIPPLEYRVSHFSEMAKDFSQAQVDKNLVTHSTDMIDKSVPEDVELYHLVLYYYGLGNSLIAHTKQTYVDDYAQYSDEQTAQAEIEQELKHWAGDESFAYVNQNIK